MVPWGSVMLLGWRLSVMGPFSHSQEWLPGSVITDVPMRSPSRVECGGLQLFQLQLQRRRMQICYKRQRFTAHGRCADMIYSICTGGCMSTSVGRHSELLLHQ